MATHEVEPIRFRGGSGTALRDSPFFTTGDSGIPQSLRSNAPYFGLRRPEDRNRQLTGSVSSLLSSKTLGSHDLKTGVERFTSTNTGGNSQSSTGYVYWANYVADEGRTAAVQPDGTLTPIFEPGGSESDADWMGHDARSRLRGAGRRAGTAAGLCQRPELREG